MDLKEPQIKRKIRNEFQPTFPIFIESEVGVSVNHWIPISYTGIFDGACVKVNSPSEICALFNMGNFGKGSNSRSKPHIIRNHPELPHFMRKRQYEQRKKWENHIESNENLQSPEGIVEEIHSLFSQLVEQNVVKDLGENEVNLIGTNTKKTDDTRISELKLPPNSVVVLPDSDSETDDYFENLSPKIALDNLNLSETLILSLEEAYFLAYGLGCLQIKNLDDVDLTLEESWKIFCKVRADFPVRYVTYHHFRSKGWIVKPGIKFGGDFLLYKKGQPYYHSNYIVIIRTKDKCAPNWLAVQNYIRLAATASKEIIFADVIVPENTLSTDLHRSPDIIKKIFVCETLLRRWTSGEKRKN